MRIANLEAYVWANGFKAPFQLQFCNFFMKSKRLIDFQFTSSMSFRFTNPIGTSYGRFVCKVINFEPTLF